MNHPSLVMQSALADEPRSVMGTRLHGRRLLLAWGLWGGVLIFELGMIGVSLPGYLWQLSPDALQQLEHLGFPAGEDVAFNLAVLLLMAVPIFALATFLLWRRANDWMALLVSLMLIGIGPLNITNTVLLSHWVGPALASTVLSLSNLINLTIILLTFYLFPDGRFVPRFTRWIVGVGISANLLFILFPALAQSLIGGLLFVGVLASLIVAQVYRYRRVSTLMQRQQTKWIVYSLAVVLILALSLDVIPQLVVPALGENGSLYSSISSALTNLLTILIPIAFGIAILRYRLWDIDILINRTLVYGLLTASIVGIYVLVVGGLGSFLQAQGNSVLSLVATGLVAVLFQPLRARLQRAVNHLMYGERDAPYTVISRLGKQLEATVAPESVLPLIVETVAQALKLPYAAITLKYGDEFSPATSYGRAKEEVIHLPLVYQSEQVGELLLAPRAPGESFTPADRRLLDDLARQAGIAVHAVRLTQELKHLTRELQHARERLVSAREEERRRLRRDLHDGLGPQLSSQTLLLTSAQMLLRQDPDEVEAILKSAVTQSQQAISDIRRLVYALRPPALDDLGLVAAIQEQLTQNRASGIVFSLDAPEQLPPLPAAVEVACYRIVQEALANVVRHAHARTCIVRLGCGEQLNIEVKDDGQGLPPAYHCGVGLTSMRERAEELGGSWLTESGPDKGTRVRAQIPYR